MSNEVGVMHQPVKLARSMKTLQISFVWLYLYFVFLLKVVQMKKAALGENKFRR